MSISISVCIITRNNESMIDTAIRSVERHVDEIIVIDTGSMDRTPIIAQQLGATVHSFEWCEDFSIARNECLRYCHSDWVLVIDADEKFVWNSHKTLREWVIELSLDKSIIAFECEHYHTNSSVTYAMTHVERLFSRKYYRYEGKIHEKLVPIHQDVVKDLVVCDGGMIIHYGYSPEFHEAKSERNIRILLRSLEANPQDGPIHRYLANEYYNQGQYLVALRYCELALKYIAIEDTYVRAQAYYYTIMSYIQLNNVNCAEGTIFACIDELPRYSDPYGILGEVYYNRGDWKKAVHWFSEWESRYHNKAELLPKHNVSLSEVFLLHRNIASYLNDYHIQEVGITDMKIAILIKNPELEQDWEGLSGHLKTHFSPDSYLTGIWIKAKQDEIELPQNMSWFKQERFKLLQADTMIEAATLLTTNSEATHIWFWDANERLAKEYTAERLSGTLSEAGSVVVHVGSDRLKYSANEQRIWPVHLISSQMSLMHLEAAPAAVSEALNNRNKGARSSAPYLVELSKPLFIPSEYQAQYRENGLGASDVTRLLVAFGSQEYAQVLEMMEPEYPSSDWAVFRFYRIMAAYNMNKMEQASEWIFDALDKGTDQPFSLDFIYIYGKLALNANINEMKLEAIALLEEIIRSLPIINTCYVVTTESHWMALVAELQWQTGNRKQALITWRQSLEITADNQLQVAYRVAEALYEEYKADGKERISRAIMEMFGFNTVEDKRLLYSIFSYLNMQEWALLFQAAEETDIQSALGQEAQPLVSIVLPVYQNTRYLFDSILSILSQTYLNLELIIVDDGTGDAVTQITERFQYDARVKTYSLKTNTGLPNAINYGLSRANGTIMGWTSADNTAHPRWLERMISSLVNHPEASAVYSDYYHVDEDGILLETKRMSAYVLNGLQNGGPSLLWRASALRKSGNFDPTLFGIEDRDFTIRLALTGTIVRLPEPLYYYRIHKESLSSQIDSGALGGWPALHEKLKEKWLFLSYV